MSAPLTPAEVHAAHHAFGVEHDCATGLVVADTRRETYVCAAPKCRGRRHRLTSLIGRAHLTFTVWTATS